MASTGHSFAFSLYINNVKHEWLKVWSYCDPTSNLYLELQKCVSWCQCGPIHLMTIPCALSDMPHFQRTIETWAVKKDSLVVGLCLTDFLIYDVLGRYGSQGHGPPCFWRLGFVGQLDWQAGLWMFYPREGWHSQ